MQIQVDDPRRDDVLALLAEHLADMYATSPAESVHALDPDALAAPSITFFTARDADGTLLGCGALKDLGDGHGEIKSMRTPSARRRRGAGAALLDHLVVHATGLAWTRLSLETGTESYFAPARALYASRGFRPCGPFADSPDDPLSAYFTLSLTLTPAMDIPKLIGDVREEFGT